MNKNNKKMFFQNRFTLMSLVIGLGMFMIVELYYSPDSTVRKGVAMVEGTGIPKIGGEFDMLDKNGKQFTHENLLGKYTLMFFGYTNCPEVCPTGMAKITAVYDALSEKERKQMQVVLVSVDVERDTVEVMKSYVEAFNPQFIGLSGSKEQAEAMAKKYLVYHTKTMDDGQGNYMINHSSFTYLLGPDGRYMKHFPYSIEESEMLKAVESYFRK